MSIARILLGTLLAAASAAALANDGSIELSSFPSVGVSDGRTPLTVTALVRDNQGRLVPNGTQVVFESTLGSFRESVITTENGYARASLVSPSQPGIAKVRAASLRYGASSTIEVEFVADRTLLNTAKEFIEVTSPRNLFYSVEDKTIEASGPDRGVNVRYRDIDIRADDLQLQVATYTVKARNAEITFGQKSYRLQELVIRLNHRRGLGMAEVEIEEPRVVSNGFIPAVVMRKRMALRPVEVSSAGFRVLDVPLDRGGFLFQDITGSLSSVESRKAVVYPQREIYFYRSNVRVSGASVMRVPLFSMKVNASSPLITEQFFNVTNTNLNVNYPYYLTLKPGETSLVRLRYGNRFGTGIGATQGLLLDYEMSWNRGDEMAGGLTFYGMNRPDWGASLRQFFQFDPSASMTAQVDFPAHRSMYANLGFNKSFTGFQANLSAVHGRSLGRSERFTNEQYSLVVERDPIKLGAFPAQLFLGVNATSSRYTGGLDRTQNGVGWQARMATRPISLGFGQSLTASYRISQSTGQNVRQGFNHLASVGLSTRLAPGVGLFTTYDYQDDGFSSAVLGRHRVTSEATMGLGALSLSGLVSKSLDVDRLSASANARWRISGLWGLYYSYSFDRYFSERFMDQGVILGYRLGFREIGLSYSHRTRRIGIEILGSTF